MDHASEDSPVTRAPRSVISVLIADDDALARKALQLYLSKHEDIRVVAVCEDGEAALRYLDQHEVDVAVLDVRMPRMDGPTAARSIRASHPGTRILMLTSFDDDELIMDAVAIGASGFLLKTSSPVAFGDAIRAAHSGMTVLSRTPARLGRPAPDVPMPDFSDREVEVMRQLCRGLRNQEIAEALFLSESTVKTYTSSIMVKLGVTSRLQAVLRAQQLGLAT